MHVTLPAEAADGLSTAQVAVIIVGVVLAVTAAIVTNFIAAKRGQVKATFDEKIDELQGRIQRAHTAMAQSLATHRSACLLWAVAAIPPAAPGAFYESHFSTTVAWLTQAGADAASGLGLNIDSTGGPEKTPELDDLFRARNEASAMGPAALQALINESDNLRSRLIPYTNDLVGQLRREVLRRSKYERSTSRLLSLGTSIQILSLVVIAAKDLL
ncbi:UNVERIFIED_ORG: hypothetical protein E4P37_06460 [Bacillus sp. AZ43]